jgi:protein involved in polysaccharide export with SLBB domain
MAVVPRSRSRDVLTITSYDQADLSGTFTVEADGTFTHPLVLRCALAVRRTRGELSRNQALETVI